MAYILDIAVILIFVGAIAIGYHRGIIKMLSKLIALVAAVAVAAILCGPVATWLFDHTMAPSIRVSIADRVEEAGNNIGSGLDEAFNKLPAVLRNALAKEQITSLSQYANVADSSTAISEHITTNVVRPVAISLLRVLCMLVLFVVAFIVALLIMRSLDKVFRLPGLRKVNKSLGAVAGVISGVLWVVLFVAVVHGIASAASADALISQSVVDQTYVVRFLLNLNPAQLIMRG